MAEQVREPCSRVSARDEENTRSVKKCAMGSLVGLSIFRNDWGRSSLKSKVDGCGIKVRYDGFINNFSFLFPFAPKAVRTEKNRI